MNPQITPTIEQIKEQVHSEWTDPGTVATWRKWHSKFVIQTREVTEALLQIARVTQGLRILDLASGTGEPAITLAGAVGPNGHVMATDLGPGMLEAARQNAGTAGVTNISFQGADAHALPFPDEAFDRVTCRFGVMYFADVGQALSQVRRVLRRGGLVALTAWGPLEQSPLTVSAVAPFLKRVGVPPSAPGSPNPFRFASSGSLAHELEQAGFERVEEQFRTIDCSWPGSTEQLWESFREIASSMLGPMIYSLPPEEREAVNSEVVEAYRSRYDGERVNATVTVVLATGMR